MTGNLLKMASTRIRTLIGSLLLLVFVTVYTLLAMWLGATQVNQLGKAAQLAFYVVAGLAWAFPAYAIIRWSLRPPSSG